MTLGTAADELRLGTHAHAASVSYTVHLTNRGPLTGGQRVLCFARPKAGAAVRHGAPRQRLWGYTAVPPLAVGESTTLTFTLSAAALATSNAAGDRVVHPGMYEVAFFDGAHETTATLSLTGEAQLVERSAFGARAVEQQA